MAQCLMSMRCKLSKKIKVMEQKKDLFPKAKRSQSLPSITRRIYGSVGSGVTYLYSEPPEEEIAKFSLFEGDEVGNVKDDLRYRGALYCGWNNRFFEGLTNDNFDSAVELLKKSFRIGLYVTGDVKGLAYFLSAVRDTAGAINLYFWDGKKNEYRKIRY